MNIFGFTIGRRQKAKSLSSVSESRGWHRILESFGGAWQKNIVVDHDTVLSFSAVYACMTLISQDIAKLRVKLVQQDSPTGIWTEVSNPSFSPVLQKPNGYQDRIQFWQNWMLSKLTRGNVYVLKQRDNRGVVTGLYILDPNRVTAMVADDGSVFYQLQQDNLAGLESAILVPAREIIHDRMNCLFHPLVGTSPLFAAGVAATQGLRIQNNSAQFFGSQSMPGGLLSADGKIEDATANRLKEHWDNNYTGANAGKVAVLGDGLKYQQLTISAADSQLIEQLRWTGEVVCSVFHVPPYKVGIGAMPLSNNIQSLNVEYYSQCLQYYIESAELCLDEGLGLDTPKAGKTLGTEFDLDGLLRMDSVTQMATLKESAGILTPNEMRKKLDAPPKPGGDSPMVQQQNFSLEALAKRDASADPFGVAKPAVSSPPPVEPKRTVSLTRVKMIGRRILKKAA